MEQNINQKVLFENNENYLNFCKSISSEELFKKDYQLIYKIWVLYDLYSISSEEFKIKETIKESLDKDINENLNNWVIKRLLETAFIFANLNSDDYVWELFDDEKENKIEEIDGLRNKSYRIAISIYYYWKYLKEEIVAERKNNDEWFFDNNNVIYRLFTRLWILSKARDEKIDNIDIFSIDLQWKIEATNKEINNKFCISDKLKANFQNKEFEQKFWENFEWFKNDEVFFSDFQKWVMDNLFKYKKNWWWTQWKSIAISAPTSAWKTFILKKYIIYKILESHLQDSNINIVFIVPSKALINELKADFIDLFNDYKIKNNEICSIHTHISWDEFTDNYKSKSNLFIFTQERLNFFYSSLEESKLLKIDLTVVDEAHKVWYWYRWTLLSYIISKIKKDNFDIQIVLLAPLLSKLNKFKKEFWLDNLDEQFSNFWLVAKNEVYIERETLIKEWTKQKRVYLLFSVNGDKLFKLATWSKIIDSQPKYMTFLARNFTWNDNQSILFRIFPWDTKEQAKKLYELESESTNSDLNNLFIYIKDTLPNIELSNYVKKWIAYHNWILPVTIKSEIEFLFKEKKLKYLCANSTVLEWVNLPAKNIFIWSDWWHHFIKNSDFKNLIWRAWRLNNHLNWTIFYIDHSEYTEKISTEDNITEDFNNNITNTLDDTIETSINWKSKFDRFLEYLKNDDWCFKAIKYLNDNHKIILDNEIKDFEYMTWFLLSKYIDDKNNFLIEVSQFIYEKWFEKYEKLEKLEQFIKIIYSDIIYYTSNNEDDELFKIMKRNIFIDPRKQLRFYVDIYTWNNKFINENIENFSNILKLFNNTKILSEELKVYWDKELEVKITEKSESLRNIFEDVQKYFIRKYQFYSEKQDKLFNEYFSWNDKFNNEQKVLKIFNSWICSFGLNEITTKDNFEEKIKIINNEIQFNYLNAFNIYFEIANLWYKRYIEENEIKEYNKDIHKLDINFIYYMELWTFYPNLLYLISKWVSRESAIWLKKNNIIKLFPYNDIPEKEYFKQEKNRILSELEQNNKIIIKNELNKFIY